MELLAGARIALTPRPQQSRAAVLEAGLLGHCPGRVRPQRLRALPAALDEMRAVGYGAAVDALLGGNAGDLSHLPIPLRASAEFHDIFPDALAGKTAYASLLAGDRAWLGLAVDDFFANGGEKCWVVKIPEGQGQSGFLPGPDTQLHAVETLQGLATLLVIPTLGLVAFPDLERLQIPPRLPDIPRVRLDNPRPEFLPCTQNTDDGHRERRNDPEMVTMPVPALFNALLGIPPLSADDLPAQAGEPLGILRWLVNHRPDLQCLWTLPLAYSGELDTPVLDPAVLRLLSGYQAGVAANPTLRHAQFLCPYLRGPGVKLASPVGLIAGLQAAVARRDGPWRSMAAKPLRSEALPYPRLSIAQTLALRDKPGIGVITYRNALNGQGQLLLDDERLVVPALPVADYPADAQRRDGFRSAEVMRFLGFLRRQLQALGEQLVFNLDYRDPRPRLLLEQFFRRLYAQGALRGASAEQAFSINESTPQEGAMVYEIMLAPAFPIDRLVLTFTNRDGEWRSEVADG